MLGSKISACFDFVAEVGQEVDSLSGILRDEMMRAMLDAPLMQKYSVLKWAVDYRYSDSGWTCTDVIYDLPLIIKRRRTVGLYLGFQISLNGPGMRVGGNREPLLHVFCWRSGPASMKDSSMAFPLKDEGENLQDGSLFVFGDENRTPRSWAFTIALTGINTIEDVRKKVIKPMQALLLGAPAREALTADIGGLIHYEGIEGKPGDYTASVVEA